MRHACRSSNGASFRRPPPSIVVGGKPIQRQPTTSTRFFLLLSSWFHWAGNCSVDSKNTYIYIERAKNEQAPALSLLHPPTRRERWEERGSVEYPIQQRVGDLLSIFLKLPERRIQKKIKKKEKSSSKRAKHNTERIRMLPARYEPDPRTEPAHQRAFLTDDLQWPNPLHDGSELA